MTSLRFETMISIPAPQVRAEPTQTWFEFEFEFLFLVLAGMHSTGNNRTFLFITLHKPSSHTYIDKHNCELDKPSLYFKHFEYFLTHITAASCEDLFQVLLWDARCCHPSSLVANAVLWLAGLRPSWSLIGPRLCILCGHNYQTKQSIADCNDFTHGPRFLLSL